MPRYHTSRRRIESHIWQQGSDVEMKQEETNTETTRGKSVLRQKGEKEI